MNRTLGFLAIAALGMIGLFLQGVPSAAYAQTSGAIAENAKPPLQIVNKTGIKVVVQVNAFDTVPNGIAKQVLAVKNLHDQYAALGMKPGKDYKIIVVFRGEGARFLLTDEAYDAKVQQPHPSGNPSRALIEALHQDGVKMYECGVAMKMLGYEPKDILPFSRIVVSGIGALVDFEKSGYLPITP